MARVPRKNRITKRSPGARAISKDALALAKMELLQSLAQAVGDVVPGQVNASSDVPTSTDAGTLVAGANIATAHRGASQTSRALLSWGVASPVDPNLETVYELPALRSRSRDLERNNPTGHGAIWNPKRHIIGPGLTLHPALIRSFLSMSEDEADAWESRTKALFDMWAASQDADARRQESFYNLQEVAYRSILASGEIFATMPLIPRRGTICDFRVKLIESDRISNPYLTYDTLWRMAGIEVDVDGAPIAYWIETTPTWLNVIRTWERADAFGAKSGRRNVLHLFRQQRPGDKRGVPLLSPVIESLKQLSRYSEAELMAAVISAMFTVFVTSETGESEFFDNGLPTPRIPSAPEPDNNMPPEKRTLPLGNGMVHQLLPGEKIDIADPKRPNALYQPFVDAHLRQIGQALGIPYEVLVQHFSSSYSASRAALLEAWVFFLDERQWFANGFCQPIYEEWLAEMVATNRIPAPGFFESEEIRRAYRGAEWIGSTMGQIDPVKETNAAILRINAGLSTIERESRALNGTDWQRNFQQRAKEEATRLKLGLDFTTNINPITGDDDGKTEDPGHPGQAGDTDTP